jgi:hypothetical protein
MTDGSEVIEENKNMVAEYSEKRIAWPSSHTFQTDMKTRHFPASAFFFPLLCFFLMKSSSKAASPIVRLDFFMI